MSTQPHPGEGIEVVGLMVCKAQEWALLGHQMVAMAHNSIPLLSTYGDRPSPKAGTFTQFGEGLGRLVPQGTG